MLLIARELWLIIRRLCLHLKALIMSSQSPLLGIVVHVAQDIENTHLLGQLQVVRYIILELFLQLSHIDLTLMSIVVRPRLIWIFHWNRLLLILLVIQKLPIEFHRFASHLLLLLFIHHRPFFAPLQGFHQLDILGFPVLSPLINVDLLSCHGLLIENRSTSSKHV